MTLQESGEMYLETILILSQTKPSVRAIDVSEYMGFSKPSVSRALSILRNGGYLLVDKDGFLTLTDEGKKVAETIYERHQIITKVLRQLGVSYDTAVQDACKIEHDISEETFEVIKSYLNSKEK